MQNNNWWIWLLILFFGCSIASSASGFLVTQLGFPYTWVSPFMLIMVGTMVFLAYRGYSLQTWLLAACIGFILISITAIGRALLIPDPHIPEVYREEFQAASQDYSFLGVNIPYSGEDTFDYTIEYDPQRDTYLIGQGYDVRTPITIEFPPIETAGGQWAFESGSVQLRGPASGNFTAEPQENWLNASEAAFQTGRTLREVRPQLTIAIPLPVRIISTPIEVAADLSIAYPQEDGKVEQTTLTRQFSLETIGPEYYVYYSKYIDWERTRSVVKTPIWTVLAVGSVLAGAGSAYLIREGALHARTSGSGLQFVIRNLTGAQRFGAALYDPRKYPDLTNARQGVYIGRVIAQSPAGRAGFRTGDMLITLAGQTINSPRAMNRIVRGCKKGQVIEATILRGGQPVDLRVRF